MTNLYRLATELPDPELRRTLWVRLMYLCALFDVTCTKHAQIIFTMDLSILSPVIGVLSEDQTAGVVE